MLRAGAPVPTLRLPSGLQPCRGSQPGRSRSNLGRHTPPPGLRGAHGGAPNRDPNTPCRVLRGSEASATPEGEQDGPEARSAAPGPHLSAAAPRTSSLPTASLTRLPGAPAAAGSSFHMGPAPQNPAACHANRGCQACAATGLHWRGLRDVRAPRTPPSPSETREGDRSAPPAPGATWWSKGSSAESVLLKGCD